MLPRMVKMNYYLLEQSVRDDDSLTFRVIFTDLEAFVIDLLDNESQFPSYCGGWIWALFYASYLLIIWRGLLRSWSPGRFCLKWWLSVSGRGVPTNWAFSGYTGCHLDVSPALSLVPLDMQYFSRIWAVTKSGVLRTIEIPCCMRTGEYLS